MVLAKHRVKLDRELKKKRKVKKIRNNLAVIFEMEEEIPSVESDEEEKEVDEDEDDKSLTEIMISLSIPQNTSQFDSIENIIAADDQLINLEVLKSQLTEMGVQEKCTYCVNG
jgi:hypothetical protein